MPAFQKRHVDEVNRLKRLAVVLPILVLATVLPVVTPVQRTGSRLWTLAAKTVAQEAPGDFSLVGLSVPDAVTPGAAQVRVSPDGRSWGAWSTMEFEAEVGPDLDSDERGAHTSMPLYTGRNRYVQVRGAPAGSKVHTVDPGPDPATPASVAMASPSKPGIITRAGWGADEKIRRKNPDIASSLKLAVVHHTATADSYPKSESDNIVRSIYAYHVKTNGWDDIGYNFLVDRYGQIFEGRYGGVDKNVIGAHSQGFNTASTGIAIIGNFGGSKPPAAAMNSLKRITAWRLDQGTVDPESSVTYVSNGSNKYAEGKKVTLRTVIGHRDVGRTACPGNPLQGALSWLRTQARKDGLPKLFGATLSRLAITPNGDDLAEGLRLTGRFSHGMNWKTSVIDAAGAAMYTVSGSGTSVNVPWYGKDTSNQTVPHGTYRFRVTGKGSAGTLRSYEIPFSVYRWPNGTFLYTKSKVTYMLYKGQLRHFSHWLARQSRYQARELVAVPNEITKYFPVGRHIGFRNGSLVKADGKIYLISDGRRLPTSTAALEAHGFNPAGIVSVPLSALAPHAVGPTYTRTTNTYPNGSALRSSGGAESWMNGGLAKRFGSTKVRKSYAIRDVEMAATGLGGGGMSSGQFGFRDGTLIRVANGTTIYIVSDGKRRPFRSTTTFKRMGFKAENILSVTPAELALHQEGTPL